MQASSREEQGESRAGRALSFPRRLSQSSCGTRGGRRKMSWTMKNIRLDVSSTGALAAAFAVALPSIQADAQTAPRRTIRIVVPAVPGGGTDIIARVVAQGLGDSGKQQVVVENRAGGSGMIGSNSVAKAAPDGNTLLLAYTSHVTNPALFEKMPYDTVKDFAPVTLVGITPGVLVVHPSMPVRTIKDLIALAKSRPGQLNYASAGNGSASHLATELFCMQAGVRMSQVPYKGTGQAVIDVVGGQVPIMIGIVGAMLPQVRDHKLRALAVTSLRRSALAPDLPTIAESALPGFESSAWFALFAPAGTPEPVIGGLNSEVIRALQAGDARERLASQGFEIQVSTPAELGQRVVAEIEKWSKVIRAANVKAE
jgi:tripartite-type tricarboxylate transporter receptor subunit TctC